MRARGVVSKLTFAMVAVFALVVSSAGTALAHVTVKPGQVETSTYQVFTVSVPNEKTISTTSVKVLIPETITSVTPTNKSGWDITIEKEGTGETARVKSITWSDGEIADGFRDEFTFSAKTPDTATELQWKAYQTYSDGTVVAWDQESSGDGHGDGDAGPFSVTNVVTGGDSASDVSDAEDRANRALYVSIAGVVVSLIVLFLVTRRK